MAVSELKKQVVRELKNVLLLNSAKGILEKTLDEYKQRTDTFELTDRMQARIQEIKMNIATVTIELNAINSALDALSYVDRRVIEKFYIKRTEHSISELCTEFCLEVAQVYKLKDKALENYCFVKNGKSMN